jgi:hypothetical protein
MAGNLEPHCSKKRPDKTGTLYLDMKRSGYMIRYISGLLFIALTATACLPGKKLAKTYINEPPETPILLLQPEFIFKTNLKEYEIENGEELTEAEQDSALFYRSLYLQYIEDEKFLGPFTSEFEDVLSDFGYRTFDESSLEEFTRVEQEAYVLNLAQILLEEYVYQHEASALVVDEVLTVDSIDLNALGVSVWFELNPVNTEDIPPVVLFANDQIVDDMEGRFITKFLQDEVLFEYEIDSLELSRVYDAAEVLGRKYASFFIDYMMNRYILKNTPGNRISTYYYHYDLLEGAIYPVEERYRFIEMDAK